MQTGWAGQYIERHAVLDSTNNRAKQLGREGAPHGMLVVADLQTAGKGRRGRSWLTKSGEAIAMTVLLRPTLKPEQISPLTLVAALAVNRAVQKTTGLRTQIKWPNDIVANGKKICGILTEMSMEAGCVAYVVIGIGINIGQKEWPQELQTKATSVLMETGRLTEQDAVIAETMRQFEYYYEVFMQDKAMTSLRKEYAEQLVNMGREVYVDQPGNGFCGICEGIDEDGRLLVRDEQGNAQAIFAGEVSVRGIYGYV